MLRKVIVQLQFIYRRLQVDDTVGINTIVAHAFDSTLGMMFGGVLVLEDLLEILGSHDYS
jgi:hypothetical protein